MKKFIGILLVSLMLLTTPCFATNTFHYGDRVNIIGGFYQGVEDCLVLKVREVNNEVEYFLMIDLLQSEWVNSKYLELREEE
jgi:hypothetical protein